MILHIIGRANAENGELAERADLDVIDGEPIVTITTWNADGVPTVTSRPASDDEAAALNSAEDETPADPVMVAAEAIRDEITDRLSPTNVNTIVEVKAAVIDGLEAAVARLRT